MTTANMQVELTYKAEPILAMTCITRVKSAEVCKEVDDDSGIEYGEVDLRVCLEAILGASPELKKEEWSVYVLDQTASETKFSGNGTITSVLKEQESVPIVGRIKKKFRREMLDIELRLVKVPISPAKKQPTLSLEQLLPLALQHSMQQSHPNQSSPVLPRRPSSPGPLDRRLLARTLQQDTPPPSSFQPYSDQLWSDFDLPLASEDYSSLLTDNTELPLAWPTSFDMQAVQQVDTPPLQQQQQSNTTNATTSATPFLAPIPPAPQPPPPKRSRHSSGSKRQKRPRKELQQTNSQKTSSPPAHALNNTQNAVSHVDAILQSESTTPVGLPDFPNVTWENFLAQSDDGELPHLATIASSIASSRETPNTLVDGRTDVAVPHVGFTAVNSTVDSAVEFTARQILLNAEFTPVSSPQSASESDSQSQSGQTPFPETPAARDPIPSLPTIPESPRQVLKDITANTNNVDQSETVSEAPVKRRPGRPKGWRKQKNTDTAVLPEPPTAQSTQAIPVIKTVAAKSDAVKKPKKPKKPKEPKEDDQWSVRIRSSIKGSLLERIAKGQLPHMCACCGELQPTSWRLAEYEGKTQRFCNPCGLYYKKHKMLKRIPTSPRDHRKSPKRRKPRDQSDSTTLLPNPDQSEGGGVGPSSPPQQLEREFEPMSEIDHPLLSEGIFLPRMGYLRGESGDVDSYEEDEDKENDEPDEDEMERLFSDVLA